MKVIFDHWRAEQESNLAARHADFHLVDLLGIEQVALLDIHAIDATGREQRQHKCRGNA